ncbi:MAG: hypothetical protein WB791_07730, partial [Waddliaceae bacterium]
LAYPQKTFKSDLIKAFRYKAMEFLLSIFLQKKYFVEFHALSISNGNCCLIAGFSTRLVKEFYENTSSTTVFLKVFPG